MTQTKKVTLDPGESQEVAFSYTPMEVKTYHGTVNGLSGSFEATIPEEAYIIKLSGLEFPSPAVVGQIVPITCKAVLSIAPVGVPVTRTVTLFINGAAVESQDVTLVREYWPASTTVRFNFTPDSLGTHNIEINGLAGTLEVVELPNYLTFTGIELVSDAHNYFQAILDAEYGVWVCPVCGRSIPIGCMIEDGKGELDTRPVKNHFETYDDAAHRQWRAGIPIGWYGIVRGSGAPGTIQPVCLDKDEKTKIGRILGHDIGLVSVDDIGFNGETGWATIRVSQTSISNYYSEFRLLAIVADRYAEFLAGIGDRTDTRYLNGRGDRYSFKFEPRKIESLEETISASGEFRRRISRTPSIYVPMPPGDYIVVVVTEQNYYNGKSFDTEFFKVWRVGEISF